MRSRWLAVAALLCALVIMVPAPAPAVTISTTGACPSATSGFPLNPGDSMCWLIDQRALYLWDGTLWQQILTVSPGGVITIPGLTLTLNNPTITGTVAGGASYTGITATNPTITGTVAGGASYTSITANGLTSASPTITGTVAGGATYTAPTVSGGTITGTVAGSPTLSGSWTHNGGLLQQPGTNGTAEGLPSPIFQTNTDVGTGADVTEDTLHTYTMPASTLTANGQRVVIDTVFQNAATATTKRGRVYFGASVIFDSTAVTANNNIFGVRCVVFRTGAATQKAICQGKNIAVNGAITAAAGGVYNVSTPAETLSGAVVIKTTGQNGTANANDCVAKYTTVDWYPAP